MAYIHFLFFSLRALPHLVSFKHHRLAILMFHFLKVTAYLSKALSSSSNSTQEWSLLSLKRLKDLLCTLIALLFVQFQRPDAFYQHFVHLLSKMLSNLIHLLSIVSTKARPILHSTTNYTLISLAHSLLQF